MSLPGSVVLKKAVDSLLCSMCHIHPGYFSLLMSWLGIVPPPAATEHHRRHHRLSMTDDGKKQHDASASAAAAAGLTDDSKHARLPLDLTESQLNTLAAAALSPGAIEQLLDSGLPSLLARSLAQLCCNLLASADLPLPATQTDRHRHHHYPHHHHQQQPPHPHSSYAASSQAASSSSSSSSSSSRPPGQPVLAPELAAPVLRFLTEVGNSHAMKDWLGGPEVNPLWTALLFLLCHSSSAGIHSPAAASLAPQPSGSRHPSPGRPAPFTTQQRTALENATVAFFLQCISCHPNNQRLMAQVGPSPPDLILHDIIDQVGSL